MREIIKDGKTLARHILSSDIKSGLNFFSQDEDFIQVGAWEYDSGKELLAHIHNEAPRTIQRTYEVLYIISGRIHAVIYDMDAVKAEEFDVCAGEVLVLLESGHGYQILEDGTRVLEVKNGPYLGAETDRHRI